MTIDSTLKQRVLDELRWDPKIDAAHIGVTANHGAVALTGHVNSYPEKLAATEAAKRVWGVKAVADDIEVHLPTEHRTDDVNIAQKIAGILEWAVSIPKNAVKAKVRDGIVMLTGSVDWNHQRAHVVQQVQHIAGVTAVVNSIDIVGQPAPEDIKEKIEAALKRNSQHEATQIVVSVSDDTVTLEGKVKAFYERDLVQRAAWSAPGVQNVVDKIHIA